MAPAPAAPASDPSHPQSFAQCLGYFLTPQVCKQAQQAAPRRRAWRWQTQPLIHVLLVMTWCTGDSLPERFETARAFYVATHQKRKRPGRAGPSPASSTPWAICRCPCCAPSPRDSAAA
jgi:hypothetical protein